MGNNNATAIKEEDNGREAEKETHNDLNHHEDSVMEEENEVNSTSKREYDETKSAEEFHVHTTSEPEKDSPREDKHRDDLKVEIQTVPTAEDKDGEENVTLPSMSTNDSFEEGTNAGHAYMENQMIPTSEGTDDQFDLTNSNDSAEHEILEVGQTERSENAESVEDGDEKCEIFSSSSLVGTEDHGNQTESTLREDLLLPNLDLLESDPKQEEEDTEVLKSDAEDMSSEAELQESPVADQVLSESSLPQGDFLDTDPISPQDNDVVIERDTETQENNVSSAISGENSLGDLSGIKSDSASCNMSNSTNLLTKVNVDNSLKHEIEENHKVLHAESTTENSLDYNSGECLQEICMFNTYEHDKSPMGPNGDSNGERIEEPTSSVSMISTNIDEAERPKENEHQFDDCDDNNPNKKDSDETTGVSEGQNHCLVFPETEFEVKEECQNPEASHAAEEVPELLEQCNSHLVTIDHVESFSLQNSNPLLHIYSYQEGNESHTKNQNASDWKQSNEAFENDCEDYSGLVEATSVNENGHQFGECDDNNHNNNNASEDQNHHLVVAEAEVVPLVAVSKIIGCIEEQEEDYNGLEGREFLEQCNSQLVTIDHVESFSFQNSDSLLHVYNYQDSIEKLNSSIDDKAFDKELEDYSVIVAAISASEANDHCTEPRESTSTKTATRFSTESNSDNADICSFQIQKSPSLNLSLQIEESDQSPLLYEDKCSTSEMPMEEEKIVTMERSYTEKSKYSEKDDDEQETSEKEVTPTMTKSKEKRKAMSSFFINCMCCATVAN